MHEKNEFLKDKNQVKSIFEKVKRLACRFTAHDVLDKDDVTQEAMIKLMTARELGKNSSWLGALVKNVATDKLRKFTRHKRHVRYHGHDFGAVVDGRASWLTKSELEQFADQEELYEALRRLSPAARQVIYLLADDYTYGEIAAATKVKLGTVRSRVFYARVQARKLLLDS